MYILLALTEKSLFNTLEEIYSTNIYILEIIIPLIIPFFFIFIVDIEVPINMLIPEIIIMTKSILSSFTLVLINDHENINNKITDTIIEKLTPLQMHFIHSNTS